MSNKFRNTNNYIKKRVGINSINKLYIGVGLKLYTKLILAMKEIGPTREINFHDIQDFLTLVFYFDKF